MNFRIAFKITALALTASLFSLNLARAFTGADRGNIDDRNMKPLVVNSSVYSVCLDAHAVDRSRNRDEIIARLSQILNFSHAAITAKIGKDEHFFCLQNDVPEDVYQQLNGLKLSAISFIKKNKKSYPKQNLASHLIGFTDADNNGLAGVEKYYNKYLKDKKTVVLTIDETIQSIVESALDQAFQKYKAHGAAIIVMDPHTGEILALASRPSKSLINLAITPAFEPGSVFKVVTASAALQENVVNENDMIYCENGAYYVVPDHALHDDKPYGTLTFKEVIEKSSSIGMTKVAKRLGLRKIYKYVRLFRFGRRTGIDLPDEAPGSLEPVPYWTKAAIAAVPIGQEIPVTPIQMLGAVSAIANDGVYMRPFVVKFIKNDHDQIIKRIEPRILGRIISPQTAGRMKAILHGVVDVGTGKKAQIKGITVGGKTGTAQKIVNGKYSHTHHYSIFAGFAPVENPRLSAIVVFDDPRQSYYASEVAAPVFSEVVGDILKYLDSNKKS